MSETHTQAPLPTPQAKKKAKALKGGIGEGPAIAPQPPESPDIQTLVNKMMLQHGTNLAERGDYPDLLAAVGMEVKQVTKKHLERAASYCNRKMAEEAYQPRPNGDSKLEWGLEPREEQDRAVKYHIWETTCHRYRAYRVQSQVRGGTEFTAQFLTKAGTWDVSDSLETKDATGAHGKVFKNLEAALAGVEKFHGDRVKAVAVTSNTKAVLERARELKLDQGVAPLVRGEKAAKQPRPPKAPRADLDSFGSREGTKESLINKQLTITPQKMKAIVAGAGLSGTFYNHLNSLVEKQLVTKTAEGYALAPAVVETK